MKNTSIKILVACAIVLCAFSCHDDETFPSRPEVQKVDRPTLKGKLIYHNYTTYQTEDSEIYVYDFATNNLTCISENWGIRNPMNAHYSSDGKHIVFMGIGETSTWDIFLYELGGISAPQNLTATGTTRDEDPKFSPDGKRVVFKQDFRVAEINLETRQVTRLSPADYGIPYYNHDGTKVICTKSDGPTSSIAVIDIKTKQINTLYDEPNVQDYYPINADEKSFYYSVGFSETNRIDQVYRGFWSGMKSKRLPFNSSDGNYSDAYPINSDWLVLCSTRTGTLGGYDLYIGNVNSGDIYSMNEYNTGINSDKNELGPCFLPEK